METVVFGIAGLVLGFVVVHVLVRFSAWSEVRYWRRVRLEENEKARRQYRWESLTDLERNRMYRVSDDLRKDWGLPRLPNELLEQDIALQMEHTLLAHLEKQRSWRPFVC